jgi:glycosyltransferase involved in cell wall biosynthesis
MHNNNKIKISLLTGGDDPSYALPLLSSLISQGIRVDFIGNNAMQSNNVVNNKNVNYLNLRGDQSESAPITRKIVRIVKYYCRLLKYTAQTDSKIFHILWLNKFVYFDRTILNLYYKMLGKKVIFTAHNVNAGERDENDTILNELSLKFMYRIIDHIFVHTEKMKRQLIETFGVKERKVTVIPFGVNNYVPNSKITGKEARARLHLDNKQNIVLFFGQIAPYKGLKYLILALVSLKQHHNDLRLIIAGRIKKGWHQYWEDIQRIIEKHNLKEYIISKIDFIPDEEVEVYFKAADVLALPYKNIFQTGVLFLAYNFGLPAIASDVGSLREEIIEGKTGYICQPENPEDLAEKIDLYFKSDLFKNLEENRSAIIEYANEKYSWGKIGEKTCAIYRNLI